MFVSEKNIIVAALKSAKNAAHITDDFEDVTFDLESAIENSNLHETEDSDVEVLLGMVNSIINSPSLAKIEAAIMWVESIEVYEDEDEDD